MIERYPFQKTRANKVLFGIFLLAMLYLTRDSMPGRSFLGFYTSQFLSLGLMGLLGVVILVHNRQNLRGVLLNGRVPLFGILALVYLLPMVVKGDWQLMYFSVLLAILFGILVSYFLSCRETAKYYVVILTVLGAYSVLGHVVLRPIAESGFLPPRIICDELGNEFFDYVLTFPTLDIETKSRNYGLFREPGVYQFFLLMGLYLNNYRVDWQKKYTVWVVNGILAITMMTTLATGGVIEMGLLAVVLFLDRKWYRQKLGRVIAIGGILCAVAILTVLYITKPPIYWELYLMMAKLFSGEDSFVDRVGSIYTNTRFFLSNPVFGARISDVLYAVENNTSSTTVLYAITGFLGGSVNVLAYGALVWDKDRFILWNLALLVILMMSFNTQNFITNPFFWLFPMLALTEWAVPRMKRRRIQ